MPPCAEISFTGQQIQLSKKKSKSCIFLQLMEGKWASGEPLHRQIVMFCYAKPAADMEAISKLTQLKQNSSLFLP